jgi:hypothetical protein
MGFLFSPCRDSFHTLPLNFTLEFLLRDFLHVHPKVSFLQLSNVALRLLFYKSELCFLSCDFDDTIHSFRDTIRQSFRITEFRINRCLFMFVLYESRKKIYRSYTLFITLFKKLDVYVNYSYSIF